MSHVSVTTAMFGSCVTNIASSTVDLLNTASVQVHQQGEAPVSCPETVVSAWGASLFGLSILKNGIMSLQPTALRLGAYQRHRHLSTHEMKNKCHASLANSCRNKIVGLSRCLQCQRCFYFGRRVQTQEKECPSAPRMPRSRRQLTG